MKKILITIILACIACIISFSVWYCFKGKNIQMSERNDQVSMEKQPKTEAKKTEADKKEDILKIERNDPFSMEKQPKTEAKKTEADEGDILEIKLNDQVSMEFVKVEAGSFMMSATF